MADNTSAAQILWLDAPEEHNYPAALSYLSLIYAASIASVKVDELRAAPIVTFKAKDIFRAASLSLLGVSNSHVKKNKVKIKASQPLSPILLVRDALHGKVVVADGYHRLCAVYWYDEVAWIPCKIV